MAYEADGCVGCDRLGDELSDEPVIELRFKLVFKLSDVRAVEDNGENTRLGADLGTEAARELQPVQGLEPRLKP